MAAKHNASKKAVDNKKTVFAPVKKDDDGVSLEERNRQLLDRVFEIQSIEDIVKNGGFKDDAIGYMPPLSLVSSLAHEDGVVKLIAGGVDVNERCPPESNTPLILAAKTANIKIVQKLLSAGAKTELVNDKGFNAFMTAVSTGSSEVVNLLWQHRQHFNVNQASKDGKTALLLAAERSWESCICMLIAGGANVKLAQKDGWSALAIAARKGDIKSAEKLLSAGAKILDVDEQGSTSLCHAITEGKKDVVSLFMQKLTKDDKEHYVLSRVYLLRDPEFCDDPENYFDTMLYPVLYDLSKHEECKEFFYKYSLLRAWMPVIAGHLNDFKLTTDALHIICEVMYHPATFVEKRFVEQFVKFNGPELLLKAFEFYRGQNDDEQMSVVFLPFLAIHETDSGKQWIEKNYHKISGPKDVFEDNFRDMEYPEEGCKLKAIVLWPRFRDFFCKIQGEMAKINAAELLKEEEDAKAKKEKQRERRREKKRQRKQKNKKPNEIQNIDDERNNPINAALLIENLTIVKDEVQDKDAGRSRVQGYEQPEFGVFFSNCNFIPSANEQITEVIAKSFKLQISDLDSSDEEDSWDGISLSQLQRLRSGLFQQLEKAHKSLGIEMKDVPQPPRYLILRLQKLKHSASEHKRSSMIKHLIKLQKEIIHEYSLFVQDNILDEFIWLISNQFKEKVIPTNCPNPLTLGATGHKTSDLIMDTGKAQMQCKHPPPTPTKQKRKKTKASEAMRTLQNLQPDVYPRMCDDKASDNRSDHSASLAYQIPQTQNDWEASEMYQGYESDTEWKIAETRKDKAKKKVFNSKATTTNPVPLKSTKVGIKVKPKPQSQKKSTLPMDPVHSNFTWADIVNTHGVQDAYLNAKDTVHDRHVQCKYNENDTIARQMSKPELMLVGPQDGQETWDVPPRFQRERSKNQKFKKEPLKSPFQDENPNGATCLVQNESGHRKIDGGISNTKSPPPESLKDICKTLAESATKQKETKIATDVSSLDNISQNILHSHQDPASAGIVDGYTDYASDDSTKCCKGKSSFLGRGDRCASTGDLREERLKRDQKEAALHKDDEELLKERLDFAIIQEAHSKEVLDKLARLTSKTMFVIDEDHCIKLASSQVSTSNDGAVLTPLTERTKYIPNFLPNITPVVTSTQERKTQIRSEIEGNSLIDIDISTLQAEVKEEETELLRLTPDKSSSNEDNTFTDWNWFPGFKKEMMADSMFTCMDDLTSLSNQQKEMAGDNIQQLAYSNIPPPESRFHQWRPNELNSRDEIEGYAYCFAHEEKTLNTNGGSGDRCESDSNSHYQNKDLLYQKQVFGENDPRCGFRPGSSSLLEKVLKGTNHTGRWDVAIAKMHSLLPNELCCVGRITLAANPQQFLISQRPSGVATLLGFIDNRTTVAVKRFPFHIYQSFKHHLPNLIGLLQDNLVPYLDLAEDEMFGYVAMELCEATLDEHMLALSADGRLDAQRKESIVWQVLRGLRYLHDVADVVHCHLKPSSIMVDWLGNVRLTDYGFSFNQEQTQQSPFGNGIGGDSCWKSSDCKSSVPSWGFGFGTPWVGLEQDSSASVTKESDIQVSGMLTYYIMTGGQHPYGDNAFDIEMNIARGWPRLQSISAEADDLIMQMLTFDPKERPSAASLLQHPYFWTADKRLRFLKTCGCVLELKNSDMTERLQDAIGGINLISLDGQGWKSLVDQPILEEAEVFRKYSEGLDGLLLFIHHCAEHLELMSDANRSLIGNPATYFSNRFRGLLMLLHRAVQVAGLKVFQEF